MVVMFVPVWVFYKQTETKIKLWHKR